MIALLFLLADSITLEQAAAAVRASHHNDSFVASELVLGRAKSHPQLILVGRKLSAESIMLEDLLEVRDGKVVSVQTGGFGWPEATIEKEWKAGNKSEREQLALRWVVEVEWAFHGVLTEAPPGFRKRFTPPSVRTEGNQLHVEAWLKEQALFADSVCYAKHRRTMSGKYWSELTQVEVDCHPK